MGFRTGVLASVWEVAPVSETSTKLKISTSYKNKKTNTYEQDFSGFVLAIGTATAQKAALLKPGDRIRLGDIDVTTKYDKEKKMSYTNYRIFSFENGSAADNQKSAAEKGGAAEERSLPF